MSPGPAKPQRFLTVPEHIDDYRPYFVTGNLYVSLPLISPTDGSVERVNVLHMGSRGLIEFSGNGETGGHPLMKPWFVVNGEPVALAGNLNWVRDNHWIPHFALGVDDAPSGPLRLEGIVFAPVGYKGFIYVLRVTNDGRSKLSVDLGLQGGWVAGLQTIYTTRRVHAHRHISFNTWSRGPILELRPGTSLAAVAASMGRSPDYCGWRVIEGDRGTGTPGLDTPSQELLAGSELVTDEVVATDDTCVEWVMGQRVDLVPGATTDVAFYWACNQDPDGARTTAIDLARRGWRSLLSETRTWLGDHEQRVPDIVDRDGRLTGILNQNLFFNYFFAQGRTIDTEELVLVTSRSPRYYVSAAFWARDALLWSFSALLLVDPEHARKVLELAFTRYMDNVGIHSLYIDGTVLYPGFELDELVAYVIVLDHYVTETGDHGVQSEAWVRTGIDRVVRTLKQKRHPSVALYETFLYPSDDPVDQPYVTYDNVLAWKALNIAARLYDEWGNASQGQWARDEAERVAQAIWDHCVVEGPVGPMFAWCVDPDTGEYTIYDEPPGSLRMLNYYGFCIQDDAVYANTVRWIFSEHNPHYYPEARFKEVGCPHTDEPFVMGLFNALLNGQVEHALSILRDVELDAGLACEGFDRNTGVVKTGAAFATCGGFLAYAMWRALVAGDEAEG